MISNRSLSALGAAFLISASAGLTACGGVSGTPTPTPAPSVADACASPVLKNAGRLTLSTDIPAFGPWWGGSAPDEYPNEPAGGSPWSEIDFSAEPYAGEGFEGSLAYAVAAEMGFTADKVDWIPNSVFENAFAPGAKPFDFHMAQISATAERAVAVTFSDPYFESNQALLALSSNAITAATSIEDLKSFRLGAAANTTSFRLIDEVINPTVEPSIFNDNAGAKQALEGNVVDGIIVDLSTAFYIRDAELEDFDTPDPEGKIVGQFGPPAQPDHVAYVLELGNPLVACVNQALAAVKASGQHQELLDEWINTGQDVPFIQ